MKKQILTALGIMGIFILILGTVKYFQISAAIAEGQKHQMPPQAVTSIIAEQEVWPRTRTAVASLAPVQGATLAAEEAGRVSAVHFDSGQTVSAGDVLVELDTAVEEAELKGAIAQSELSESNAKRQRALREKNVNSPSDLDNAEAALRHDRAEVERLRAVIARKKIIAPFSGHAGIRLVNPGETLAVGTPVVSLQSFEKLFVNFTVPQSALDEITSSLPVEVRVDAFPSETFQGTVTAIDSTVNPETRNVDVQATLDNPHEKLRPGMFAEVTVLLPAQETVVSLPASSINYAPYGDSVYVIEPGKSPTGEDMLMVRSQVVKTGRRRGDQIAILSGLKGGETVVSSGTFKLRPGMPVIVNNEVAPGNDPAPTPADT